jgi:hypothetical protein
MATALCGRTMSRTSLLSSIRTHQGRIGTVAATGVAAVGSVSNGDCASWSYDVGDFVIILDPGGSGANRDSRRYRGDRRGWGTNGDCALWSYDIGDFVIILDPGGQGRTGTVAATGVAAVGSGSDGGGAAPG